MHLLHVFIKHVLSNVMLGKLHIIFMHCACVYVIILIGLIVTQPKKEQRHKNRE